MKKYAKRYKDLKWRVRQIKEIKRECENWEEAGFNTWKMEGCPDDATEDELREWCRDDETYEEWLTTYDLIMTWLEENGYKR